MNVHLRELKSKTEYPTHTCRAYSMFYEAEEDPMYLYSYLATPCNILTAPMYFYHDWSLASYHFLHRIYDHSFDLFDEDAQAIQISDKLIHFMLLKNGED